MPTAHAWLELLKYTTPVCRQELLVSHMSKHSFHDTFVLVTMALKSDAGPHTSKEGEEEEEEEEVEVISSQHCPPSSSTRTPPTIDTLPTLTPRSARAISSASGEANAKLRLFWYSLACLSLMACARKWMRVVVPLSCATPTT